jgi:hypothetical protein
MAYIFPKDVASSPGLKNVTGRFCFPLPVSHPGTISALQSDIRPLIVDTDIEISVSGSDFSVDLLTAIVGNWGINKGDYAVFVNTGIDGIYEIKGGDFGVGDSFLLYGPAQAVSTGYVYFLNKHQKITGTGTRFQQLSVGDYLVLSKSSFTPTVQVAKIVKIVSNTELYVEQGFLANISAGAPLLSCTKGQIRGASIKCSGSGFVNEAAVANNDTLTFYDENGLTPIYGDSGASVFKILTQN